VIQQQPLRPEEFGQKTACLATKQSGDGAKLGWLETKGDDPAPFGVFTSQHGHPLYGLCVTAQCIDKPIFEGLASGPNTPLSDGFRLIFRHASPSLDNL
jgi:hypothetical protein